MPDFRRLYVHGGTYFFTLVTEGRAPILCDPIARRTLRDALTACQERWPFRVEAIVLLPDHLHSLWTMPDGDFDFSTRWAWIKKEFTKGWLANGGAEKPRSESRIAGRRRGVWQRRFWEHLVRDPDDFEAHFDYIHYNPVKHGYTHTPAAWEYSTFGRYVNAGWYDPGWGTAPGLPARLDALVDQACEPA
jgi:putative transposase